MNNGITIKCTTDQIFITPEGQEIEAKDLEGKNVCYKVFDRVSG